MLHNIFREPWYSSPPGRYCVGMHWAIMSRNLWQPSQDHLGVHYSNWLHQSCSLLSGNLHPCTAKLFLGVYVVQFRLRVRPQWSEFASGAVTVQSETCSLLDTKARSMRVWLPLGLKWVGVLTTWESEKGWVTDWSLQKYGWLVHKLIVKSPKSTKLAKREGFKNWSAL